MTLLTAIKSQKQKMVKELYQLCEINSGSFNLSGLNIVSGLLQELFKPIADDIEIHHMPEIETIDMDGNIIKEKSGDLLFIRKRPDLSRRILLGGHMDTVYGLEHPFQNVSAISTEAINGPGVADMKGGLVVMLHALQVFESTAAAGKLGWDIFINADEEIGSNASAYFIEKIAPDYKAALLYEPAMTIDGTLAKNRKGSGKLTLIATGMAAHAGRDFDKGCNAIVFLSEALVEIHKLNTKLHDITINIGKIKGGSALNVVPDRAVAKLDVRITHKSQEDLVISEIEKIIAKFSKDNFKLTLSQNFNRPTKKVGVATEILFQKIKNLGTTLGLNLHWKDSGGCCDGNNLAKYGIPIIDTLGVRGGNIHSPQEFVMVESLIERATLSALLIEDLAKGSLETLGMDNYDTISPSKNNRSRIDIPSSRT